MAIGDTTQKKLLQKALTTTATDSAVTNTGSSVVTTITSITLSNNGTTKRTISMFEYGTASSNEFKIQLEAGTFISLTGLDYILINTESYYFKQDVGTDVNISVMGITEVIA